MKQKKSICKKAIISCFALLLTVVPQTVPGEDWVNYTSDIDIFSAKIPPDSKHTLVPFRIDNERIVHSGETAAVEDQRPYKPLVRSYVIKFDQTLGPGLTREEIGWLLDREIKNYTDHYAKFGGIVRKKEKKVFYNRAEAMIHISYNDPELGRQGIRSYITIFEVTKIQQIHTGPDDSMYGFHAQEFFKHLSLGKGVVGLKGKFGEDWKYHTSPLGIYSVALPPITKPYVLYKPVVASTDKSESIKFFVHDPLWDQNIYYNTYGYKFDRKLTFANVGKVLKTNHISQYKIDPSTLVFEKGRINKTLTLETSFEVKPPKEAPYINTIRLRVLFSKNYMVVQELMGSKKLANSLFATNMMGLINFHPESANKMEEIKNKTELTEDDKKELEETKE